MFRINGCGTTLLGKKDMHEDGTYTATKWVTIFWIPVIPLGTFRIKPTDNGKFYMTPVNQNKK